MPLLEVSQLCKKFGGLNAIDRLDFTVEPGAIFGIIGPNGAGKTTVFNVLTGFHRADRGSVRLRGDEILGLKPHDVAVRGMARSFQLVKPFFGMTALETILLPSWSARARKSGLDRTEIERRAQGILEELGLGAKARAPVDALNQSELRLLDIARALATAPDILLLDEPFSGLGQDQVARLSAKLKRFRDEGLTIVIIEHRLRELMRLVERVMVVNFGAKLAEGSTAEIVRDPKVIEAYLGTKGNELAAAFG